MKKLTLNDLWLVLNNLVEHRLTYIQRLSMGALFEAELRSLHEQIGAIPGVRDESRPLATELASADDAHDAFGRALDLILRAYEALEAYLPAEVNQAVSEAREGLGEVNVAEGYIDEATAARQRRPKLAGLEGALSALPVAGLGSCKELAERFTAQGEAIDALLNQRADIEAGRPTDQAALRLEALTLLANVRQAVKLQRAMERRVRPEVALPDNIMKLIFGYSAALLQLRDRGNVTDAPKEDIDLPADSDPTEDPNAPVEG